MEEKWSTDGLPIICAHIHKGFFKQYIDRLTESFFPEVTEQVYPTERLFFISLFFPVAKEMGDVGRESGACEDDSLPF